MAQVTKRVASVFVDDKQAAATLKRLQTEAQTLQKRLSEVPHGSKEFKQIEQRLVQVQRNMRALNNDVQKSEGLFGKLKGGLGSMGGMMGGLFGGVSLGLAGITAGITKSINLFREQEKAVAKVEQAVKSTGGAAGLSLRQLQEEATRLQSTTLFGDETILNDSTAQLLTFTNIAGEQFKRTQQVAMDLATVLDGDLKSTSIQLGKALNDPVKNLSALSEAGIQFTDEQKNLINSLAKTNQLSEAQSVILDELERQYGGQAEAAAAADGGYTQLSNSLGDVMENLGGFFSELFRVEGGAGNLQGMLERLGTKIVEITDKVRRAKEFFADWYRESEDFRGLLNGLWATMQTAITGVMAFLDFTVRQPLNMLMSGVKALRMAWDGDMKGAWAELKAQGKESVNVMSSYGDDVGEIWKKAAEEVANPQAFKELSEAAEKEKPVVKIATAVDPDALRKAQDAQTKALLKLDEELQRIRDEQSIKSMAKDDADLERIRMRYSKLEEQAMGHTGRLAEIAELRDAEMDAKRQENEAKRQEAIAKFNEELEKSRLAEVQRELEYMEERHAREVEMALANGEEIKELLAMQQEERAPLVEEQREAELEALDAHYEAMRLRAEELLLSEEEIERRRTAALMAMRRQHAEEDVLLAQATDKRVLDSLKQRADAERQVISSIQQITQDLFTAAGADADEMADFQKAMTLFTIGMDTAQAISALTAMSEANPANAVTGGVAGIAQFIAGFARITANIAQATQVLSSKPKPAPPAFAVGGGTGDAIGSWYTTPTSTGRNISTGGKVSSATWGLFGEKGPEWVAPNWMYQHPTLEPVFQHLEFIRTTGRPPAFETGGSTSMAASASAAMPGGDSSAQSSAVLMQLAMTVQQLQQQLQQGITATISNDLLTENADRITTIEDQANIRR